MNEAQRKQLVDHAIGAWLSVSSPVRAIQESAADMEIELTEREIVDLMQEAIIKAQHS